MITIGAKSTLTFVLFSGCCVGGTLSFSTTTSYSTSTYGARVVVGIDVRRTPSVSSVHGVRSDGEISMRRRIQRRPPNFACNPPPPVPPFPRLGGRFAISMTVTSPGSSSSSSSSMEEDAMEYPPASDGEAIQMLFARHCDVEGLMTLDDVRNVPAIRAMLERGDLLRSELDDIWYATPKFPREEDGDGGKDKIDVDGFIQAYRDIDDMFEDDDGGGAAEEEEEEEDDEEEEEAVAGRGGESGAVVVPRGVVDDEDDELRVAFATLLGQGRGGGDDDSMIAYSRLRQWDEISSLIEEGTLGEDEFDALWVDAVGEGDGGGDTPSGGGRMMDYVGFVRFNRALDQLFEIVDDASDDDVDPDKGDGGGDDDDDGMVDLGEYDTSQTRGMVSRPMITEEDLPPCVLFSQLANENYLVGKAELQRWGELSDMLKGGDLTADELDSLFDATGKAPGTKDMLDEDGFCAFYEGIDNLFECDEPGPGDIGGNADERELKEELLELLGDIAKVSDEEGRLLCGLDSTDLEQERVLEVVNELERETYNRVVSSGSSGGRGVIKEELVGLWDLIYSSSSTMKYNEGLSGLAGGLTRFGGLQQSLSTTKYLSDVEYTERVINKLGGKSFE
ncbi:hypothetical protein ACHAXA_008940 [Cyclostephanos tholiformis]|uniref:Uncharacterized protein n=1 Tax=Cyclostephanos tholiformis TaxID=382380 RepID=A0ABD3RG67_9STRA